MLSVLPVLAELLDWLDELAEEFDDWLEDALEVSLDSLPGWLVEEPSLDGVSVVVPSGVLGVALGVSAEDSAGVSAGATGVSSVVDAGAGSDAGAWAGADVTAS